MLVSHTLTESRWRESEVLHACAHQGVELLPLGAAEQAESLLRDPLGRAARSLGTTRPTPALPAQPPRPLHALPPQQWVIRGMGGRGRGGQWLGRGGVAMRTRATEQRLSELPRVLIVLHRDGHLRLMRRKHVDMRTNLLKELLRLSVNSGGIRLYLTNALDEINVGCGVTARMGMKLHGRKVYR